jgi:hypothetical protein
MPLKRPLPLLVPQRLRNVPRSFAWIDHRLRSEAFLPRLLPEDLALYLFLVLAADQRGLSCWRLDRIARDLASFDLRALAKARARLAELDVIAYRPWRSGERDGCYQVLSVPRSPQMSPGWQQVLDRVFHRVEDPAGEP